MTAVGPGPVVCGSELEHPRWPKFWPGVIGSGGRRPKGLDISGLPDSQALIDSLSHLKIPTSLALLNTAGVLAHQIELAEVLSESADLEFFNPVGSRDTHQVQRAPRSCGNPVTFGQH